MRWSKSLGTKSSALVVAAMALAACQTVDPVPEGSARIAQAWSRNELAPPLSGDYGKEFTLDTAYRVQRAAFQQFYQGTSALGFKAALTSPAAQQMYGVNQPLAAALPPNAQLKREEDGYHQVLKEFRQPMAELEIGFRIGQRIKTPIADVRALQALVTEISPVVELPEFAHQGADNKFGVTDIIASNAGARRLILGAARAPAQIDANNVAVTLYREGEVLTQGTGRDVLGDQWQALLWLVNRVVASGWQIEPGQLLITGTMGRPVKLRDGLYVADFGKLGRIEWMAE
ncbi:MAG: 2-keto-4-pentenoate hydratase [Verrucomicrobiaceae bacterium]|nr:2-keto-4-pentenoate hydratase [Verrucomicrobiaceae bacterium]